MSSQLDLRNMRLRLRLGPFTFGRTGTRLSLWRRGSGVSIPLSGKRGSFGKIGVGPLSWHFRDPIVGLLLVGAAVVLLLIAGFVLLVGL